ncbi:MAG: tetratricopeptide repeat protein [Rhodospirillaceae bacterium]|nr:MAG: tetratricopeptide repeat protein [Rhodospirillaceae bacterium]
MSVLYKALQKAAKDNEQHQAAAAPFDAERLAGSGVIRSTGGGRLSWRIAAIVVSVAFVAAMGVAYYLTTSEPAPPPRMQTAVLAPPAHAPVSPASAPMAASAPTPVTPAPAAPAPAMTPAAPAAQVAAVPTPPTPVAAVPSAPPEQVAEAAPIAPSTVPESKPSSPAVAATKPAEPPRVSIPKPMTREPMPEIAADSPTRMLSPPISVHRAEADLGGVGNAVQVRQVSQDAQDNVGAGYAALIHGDYDTALGFYDLALKSEPTSVLASLGHAAALQKLGRSDEARVAYEKVLKLDPANREALTNLTGILADREPGEALKRLLDLEKEYSNFSPIIAQIGMTYAKMDNLEAATDFLRRAVAMTPDAVMYNYDLAVVLDRMKLGEQAAASYRQVLQLMDGRNVPELSRIDIERRVAYLTTK